MEALAATRKLHEFDVWAYVLMPEHIHLLIFPREDDYSISDILMDVKRPVAQRALRYVRQHAPSFLEMMRDAQPNGKTAYRFWQRGGGYDRNLVNPRLVHATIDTMHANPVRRGLVHSPDEWPWSSAGYYYGRGDGVLIPDVGSLPPRSSRA